MSEIYIKNNGGYELNPIEAKKTFEVAIRTDVAVEDLENIVITALEGGIGYWAMLDNSRSEWANKRKDMPVSQYALGFLLARSSLVFLDAEDTESSEEWILTLDKLLIGIGLFMKENGRCLEDIDADGADQIFQYALFGELVYG